ncbi:MAG: hypothetical protein H2069_10350 [Legionella sp.]|nr:hypothetical protein [Legionella sp.]
MINQSSIAQTIFCNTDLKQYINSYAGIKNQLGKNISPKDYNVDYLNTNKSRELSQKSFEIERIKELHRNQKELDIEL